MTQSVDSGKWKLLALVGVLFWAYLPTFRELFHKWMNDSQYSHGILVPLFVGYLVWRNWERRPTTVHRLPLLGYAVLLLALVFRAIAAGLYFTWLDGFSLLVTLVGITLVLGGVQGVRWLAGPIAFLIFMIPLPYRLEIMLGYPLQRIATISSTFLLQTLMQPALAEGNTILINEVRLGVVEACSGLRMLMSFFTFAVGATLLMSDRPKLERILVVLSAIPIALLTNILRITCTGLVHVWTGSDPQIIGFIHDFNGWLMMPVALGFLALELWILRNLFITQHSLMTRRPLR